jgi:DnaD/phage-associated family protein
MFFQIEELYARPLSSEELAVINGWADDYGFSEQVILLLVNDCAKRDIKNFNYLSKVAKSWFDSDVKTYDDALDYLSENKLRWDRYFEIFKYLGFHRNPTETEQKLIDSWFDKYGCDMQAVKQACDTTASTDKPSIKYINTVIKNRSEENSAESTEKQPKKAFAAKKKSRHRLTDVHDYDFTELEKRWLNKTGGNDEASD